MLILALDTTTRAGSVAVTRDDEVLAVVRGDGTRTHGERLPAEIERALSEAGIAPADLGLLVVASGPGAFTGLRIGLAAVQGLAMVLQVPVVGVSALDALAATVWPSLRPLETRLFTWMDAQRGEVFGAEYVAVDRSLADPIVATPAAILDHLNRAAAGAAVFAGDGAVRYAEHISAWSTGRSRVLEMPSELTPILARLGLRLAARGAVGPPHALHPLYVRRPDAEIERLRRS